MPRLRRWNEAEQARPGGKVEGTAFRLLPGIFDAVPLHGWGRRAELACGEIFQGAEASVEFGGRQAALAVESAQKIRDRTVALARVAFDTAGNQVAVGIASEAHAWDDVVEALHVRRSAAKAVKAGPAFAIVNGFAERPGFQEIRGFEGRGRRLSRGTRGPRGPPPPHPPGPPPPTP